MKLNHKRTFLVATIIFIWVLILVFCLPYIAKVKYNNTRELKDLFFLCQVSAFYNKDEFVLTYVPQLMLEDEEHHIIDDFSKDEVLSQYLDSALELEDVNEQKRVLKESFLWFSGFGTAIPQTTSFIVSYYDITGDIATAKTFFETLLEESENRNFEYKNGVYTRYIAFLLDVEDYEGVQKVRADKIEFLKSNGVDIWSEDDQSEHLGDGATIN
jgi:hypothetical protein